MVKFIADIGGNHNGDMDNMLNICDTAYEIGCWAVKPQFYKADKLFRDGMPIPKEWEFKEEWLEPLRRQCLMRGFKLGFSVFSPDSVKIVAPYSDFLKVSSFDAMRYDLIDECIDTKLPVFISLGLLTLDEANELCHKYWQRGVEYFHCVSEYPTKISHANLWRLNTGWITGYSDHTKSPAVLYKAVAEGVRYIEFHYDYFGNGWETKASNSCWRVQHIAEVIANIREGEKAMVRYNFPEEYYSKKADPIDGLRPMLKRQ